MGQESRESNDTKEKNQQEVSTSSPNKKSVSGEGQWSATITAAMTTVMAIATVVYAYYSYGLWRTTEKSIEMTRIIFETTHRPFVGVIGTRYGIDEATKTVIVEFHIKNTGNVLARSVYPGFNVSFGEDEQPAQSILGLVKGRIDHIIFPNTHIEIPINLVDESYEEIVNGTAKVQFYAEITYKGQFGNERKTTQTWRLNRATKSLSLVAGSAD